MFPSLTNSLATATLLLTSLTSALSFHDDFSSFNTNLWRCEFSCPTIQSSTANFQLDPSITPRNYGSWSKARYTPQRFISGTFTVRFALTARPRDRKVWWGIALWDDGVDGKFNEVNFGYTTDGKLLTDSQLLFESARRGNDTGIMVETGVNLYDGRFHNATLEYSSERVAFYFDGKFMAQITDKGYIPTDPMDFILGPRLVAEPVLKEKFVQSVDWVEIEA